MWYLMVKGKERLGESIEPGLRSLLKVCFGHQGKPADQEPGGHSQERTLCAELGVPGNSASGCTKVSVIILILLLT